MEVGDFHTQTPSFGGLFNQPDYFTPISKRLHRLREIKKDAALNGMAARCTKLFDFELTKSDIQKLNRQTRQKIVLGKLTKHELMESFMNVTDSGKQFVDGLKWLSNNLIISDEEEREALEGKSLDKLAQLRNRDNKPENKEVREIVINTDFKTNINNKLQAIYDNKRLMPYLIALDSPLKTSYEQTLQCGTLLIQDGKKFTSRYCGQRGCKVCARIRTGKAINNYLPQIQMMKGKYFVTLTVPNVEACKLETTINEMQAQFVKIKDLARKKKMKLSGIRKLEITYNPVRNDYHPHYHFIIESKSHGNYLKYQWLKRFPDAKEWCQKVQEANDASVMELFKYSTKFVNEFKETRGGVDKHYKGIYPVALDTIFQVLYGRRVFQTFGKIKRGKLDEENVEERISIELDGCEERQEVWGYENEYNLYANKHGEMLTYFTPLRYVDLHTQRLNNKENPKRRRGTIIDSFRPT